MRLVARPFPMLSKWTEANPRMFWGAGAKCHLFQLVS